MRPGLSLLNSPRRPAWSGTGLGDGWASGAPSSSTKILPEPRGRCRDERDARISWLQGTPNHSVMKQTTNAIRVGFLGTGYIADWHAKALGTIPGVSLAAVCDKDLPRARAFGERHGAARCYESLEQMLGDGEARLDVVHVLLP